MYIIRISCHSRRSGRSRLRRFRNITPSRFMYYIPSLHYGFDYTWNIIKTTNGLEECVRRHCHRRTSCTVTFFMRRALLYQTLIIMYTAWGGGTSHRFLAEKFKVRFNTMPSRLPTVIKKFRLSVF